MLIKSIILLLLLSGINWSLSFHLKGHFSRFTKLKSHISSEYEKNTENRNNAQKIYYKIEGDESPLEFTTKIKMFASRRLKMKFKDKTLISRIFLSLLSDFNLESLSECIWSLGTLKISLNLLHNQDMRSSCDDKNLNENSNLRKYPVAYNNTQLFLNTVHDISGEINSVQSFRIISGLRKMGLKWYQLPQKTRDSFIDFTFFNTTIENGKSPISSREMSSILYILGSFQDLKNDKLPEGYINSLLNMLEIPGFIKEFNPLGLVNTIYGIAHLGIRWDELSKNLRKNILEHSIDILPFAQREEFCSFIQSLGLMRVNWDVFPAGLQIRILSSLNSYFSNLYHKETANVIWALGKMNFHFFGNSDYLLNTFRLQENNEFLENESKIHLIEQIVKEREIFKQTLLGKLSEIGEELEVFDLSSILLGLGNIQLNFNSFDEDGKQAIVAGLTHNIKEMNIFQLHDTLFGLARMGCNKWELGSRLSGVILEKTILVYHTFLPTQHGNLVWSLGALGFTLDDFPISYRDRLQAVSSRIFPKFHVRAVSYLLWGLAEIGFRWDTHLINPARSVVNGREAPALSESIIKYLKQKVPSMKEHEFSVLLYSLGKLNLKWSELPDYVVSKIDHRVTRVECFISSRSLSNALCGLKQMNLKWEEMSFDARNSWENALNNGFSSLIDQTDLIQNSKIGQTIGTGDNKGITKQLSSSSMISKGLEGMRPHEFASVLHSLGFMGFTWEKQRETTQKRIINGLNRVSSALEKDLISYGKGNRLSFASMIILSRTAAGWTDMNIPSNKIPENLKNLLKSQLILAAEDYLHQETTTQAEELNHNYQAEEFNHDFQELVRVNEEDNLITEWVDEISRLNKPLSVKVEKEEKELKLSRLFQGFIYCFSLKVKNLNNEIPMNPNELNMISNAMIRFKNSPDLLSFEVIP